MACIDTVRYDLLDFQRKILVTNIDGYDQSKKIYGVRF